MPIDTIEEARFEALRKNCRDLGVPAPPEIHINFKVHDKNGDLVFEDKQRGHSWTRNWYNAALSGMTGVTSTHASIFGAGQLNGKKIVGTVIGDSTKGAGCNGYYFEQEQVYQAKPGSTFNGIVVGTNDTAFSANHYAMQSLIANGTNAGQLVYVEQGQPIAVYDATDGSEKWTITHTRLMNNNSGGDIIVKEVGLIWGSGSYSSAGRWGFGSNVSFLDERSVLSPAVTVPHGALLTVVYDISMDFSAIDSQV